MFDEDGRIIVPKQFRNFTRETKRERYLREQREHYEILKGYQQESKKTATNFGNEYKDEELEEILTCDVDDYDEILFMAKKFKRTWMAIQMILRARDSYKKNGELPIIFWQRPRTSKKKLDRWGEQILKILNK